MQPTLRCVAKKKNCKKMSAAYVACHQVKAIFTTTYIKKKSNKNAKKK
jgi:hypothetical protein